MAKSSLASKGGKSGEVVVFNQPGLPSVFDDAPADMVEGGGNVYAIFASTRSEKFTTWAAQVPGLKDGDILLFNHGDKPVKIDSLKVTYISGVQLWAAFGSNGVAKAVSKTRKSGEFEKGVRWQEVIEALVLVHLGDEIIPATMAFKGGRAKAAAKCNAELKAAATPEWAGKSPAHKVAAKMPKPALRFTAAITGGKATSKSSGNAYGTADAVIAPVSAGEIKALSDAWTDADFQAALNAAFDNYRGRVSELEALAK